MSLPKTARVIAYFLILGLYIYLTLTPSFIWGECFIKNADGSVTPFRAGIVYCVIEGRSIKGQINEEGIWSVPIVSKLPGKITVYFECDNKKYPLTFTSSVFSKHEYKVYVTESPLRFQIAQSKQSNPLQMAAMFCKGLLRCLSPGEAFAQTSKKIAKSIKIAPVPPPRPPQDELAEKVYKTIARTLEINPSQVTSTMSLRRAADYAQIKSEMAITQVKRIRLVEDLQRTFGIRISDTEWSLVNTVSDAEQIIRQKTNMKKRSGI
jgi:acyl carrier protein